MELRNDFLTFLREIRPTENQRNELRDGHKRLRQRLSEYEPLAPIIVSDFLQGSYRRATAIRPKGDKRSDVDIIVVTKLAEDEYTPDKALELFEPFLKKHYKGKWRRQGRSLGIEMSLVDLDLVITSAPDESEYGILQADAVTDDEDLEEALDWRLNESWVRMDARTQLSAYEQLNLQKSQKESEWKAKPLRIPDRDAKAWDWTHPVEQIRWTRDKNNRCNGHFVNVVKAIKWWRLENYEKPERPKGFPLERLVAECCPDGISSVAEGITLTLESIVSTYQLTVLLGGKPQLPDYGVPSVDVFKRIEASDFAEFYDQAKEGAAIAREALDSTDRTNSGNLWRQLLGNKFPKPPENNSQKMQGFSVPTAPAAPGSGRFA